MSVAKNTITVTPSPDRLISSLMSLGHDFVTAVADIVDNSIEAEATEIVIYVRFDGKKSAVRISDNGTGMTPEVMKEAMRFGTRRDYGPSNLGKYGLGLKTASLSQCRKFTVASRTNHDEAGIHALSWDMDHLEKSKEWEVLQIQENNLDTNILSPLREKMGTVVFWDQLNSIFEYKDPSSGWAKKRLLSMCRDLENHLAMVFHRFLSGKAQSGPVKITLNGNQIKHWDPYARSEVHTCKYPSVSIEVESEGGLTPGKVTLTPFVLPRKDTFSSPKAFKTASGPLNWNQQQGFYIYRAGRMIQSGGWCGLRTADEHTKLARISLDFSPELDDAFSIDVTKMSVRLPLGLENQIRDYINPVIKEAQDTYRGRKGTTTSSTNTKETQSDSSPDSRGNGVKDKTQPDFKMRRAFMEVITLLRGVASDDEVPVLERVIKKAEGLFGK